MCGENFFIAFVHTVIPGSPPHVRGKQIERTNVDAAMGITPACAGKTEIEMINAFRLLGSPPHVRGKLPGFSDQRGWSRITPACAGKTDLFLSCVV